MTPRQREVLAFITPSRPLCYGDGATSDGHWFFHGAPKAGPQRIFRSTGFSLLERQWIAPLPRRDDQPFWLIEYQITDAGRAALRPRSR
jgi:hypothetical protein